MSKTTFSLPEIMRINGLAELKDQLTPIIEANDDLELDGSAVTSLDTAGLQLILAANARLYKNGKSLVLKNPSEAIDKAIEIAGAQGILTVE